MSTPYMTNHDMMRLEEDMRLNMKRDSLNIIDGRNYKNKNSEKTKKSVGEITGNSFDVKNYAMGMPIRSEFLGKKLHGEHEETQDKKIRSDFDLFDVKEEIKYTNDGIRKMTQTPINDFITQFAKEVSSHRDLCVSPLGIYMIFATFYISSTNEVQEILADYFGFGDDVKKKMSELCSKIHKNNICLKNIILFDDLFEKNDKFIDKIANIVSIKQISKQHASEEFGLINKFISQVSKNRVPNISQSLLQKINILGLSIFDIVVLFIDFQKTEEYKFNSQDKTKNVTMITKNNVNGKIFCCKDYTLVEIETGYNGLIFGFFMPKNNASFVSLEEKQKMKNCIFKKFVCPLVNQTTKIKLTNLLYNSSLKNLFHGMDIGDMIDGETYISDIAQNASIQCFIASHNKNANTKNEGSIDMIINNKFTYYVKMGSDDTIIAIGNFV